MIFLDLFETQEPVTETAGANLPEGSRQLGKVNFTNIIMAYHRNDPYVDIWFGRSGGVKLDRRQMRWSLDTYKNLTRDNLKYQFIYGPMARLEQFLLLMKDGGFKNMERQYVNPNPQEPGQQATLDIEEAKKKSADSDLAGMRDVRLKRELQRARGEFPTAASDVEAFMKRTLKQQDRNQEVQSKLDTENDRQDELLRQIQVIDRNQTQEIDNLEDENDQLTRQLSQIQAANARLQQTLANMRQRGQGRSAEKSKEPETAEPAPADAGPPGEIGSYEPEPTEPPSKKPARKFEPKARKPKITVKKGRTQKARPAALPAPQDGEVLPPVGQPGSAPSPSWSKQDVTDVEPRLLTGFEKFMSTLQPPAPGEEAPVSLPDQEKEPEKSVAEVHDIASGQMGAMIEGEPGDLESELERQDQSRRRHKDYEAEKTIGGYEPEEWDAMVRRVGQRAKQGPLKTVWDPDRRVYKNVPIKEVSDQLLMRYLTAVDADARRHPADPSKRSAAKRNRSVAGFSRAFNKLDARKAQDLAPRVSEDHQFANRKEFLDARDRLYRRMANPAERENLAELKKALAAMEAQAKTQGFIK